MITKFRGTLNALRRWRDRPRPAIGAALALLLLPVAARAQGAAGFAPIDVKFMQGMIGHHAQALQMCELAGSHGASERVNLLCKKIRISQRDEIVLMQHWLEDRQQQVPHPATDTMAIHHPAAGMADMPGMQMNGAAPMMPGMLTPEQMQALDQARDTAFDRLFLTGMIQHHNGALTMVADLFASSDGGQGAEIFRYATDVDADQRAEIGRMQQLLKSSPGS